MVHSPPVWRRRREPSMANWRSGALVTAATWTPAPPAMPRSICGTWAFSTCFQGRSWWAWTTPPIGARTCLGPGPGGPSRALTPATAISCLRRCVSACRGANDPPRTRPPDPNSPAVTDYLDALVPNPFQCFFTHEPTQNCPNPTPMFDAADVAGSRYLDDTIPQSLLLEPYPQFDGGFEGLPPLNATSWYHSLQIRFQKRASHYISFEGNYTFSKSTDDSAAGRNAWIGNLQYDNPQLLDNLKAEHGISANDAPHRLTAAVILDLPVGRDRWIGGGMNRVLDGIVGGWSLNSVVTMQSGQPLGIYNSVGRLADGNPRPNVVCSQLRTGLSYREAAASGGTFLPQSGLFRRSWRQHSRQCAPALLQPARRRHRQPGYFAFQGVQDPRGQDTPGTRRNVQCLQSSALCLPGRWITGRHFRHGHFHHQQLP